MSAPTDVQTIVAAHLKANGFDGLLDWSGECSCMAGDIAPCSVDSGIPTDCRPGYKVPCPGPAECEMDPETGCEFHIGPDKPAGGVTG